VKTAATHVYVYAAAAGRPGTRSLSRLPGVPDGSPPRTLPLDDEASLIVSDVPSSTYNATALEPAIANVEWVSRCGAAHHHVIDQVAKTHAVVPFRLFTLFSTESKALATLRRARTKILKALARVDGRQEWVLRIGPPDPAQLVEGTAAASRSNRNSGTGFLRAKAEALREARERVERVRSQALAVFDALQTVADESIARPIEPGTNLVLDAAFLVGKPRTAAFRQALKRTAAGLLRDGCRVSLTGPWPPYSFASIEARRHG